MPGGRTPVSKDLTVVIPTLGRPLLADCLRSLAAGSTLPGRIVVVDQGGRSETDEWVGEIAAAGVDVRHIRSSRRGTAAAMNEGLGAVESHLVGVTHDDCRVAPEWAERLLAHLDQAGQVIVTGQVRPEGDEPVPGTITNPDPARFERPLLKRDPLFPDNMGFPLTVAREVGPFDEDDRLRFAEDNDWSYRALKAGVPIVYAPDLVVTHLAWRDAQQRATTYRNYARSQGGLYGKHLRRGDGFIALRSAFDLARGPWMWIRGKAAGDADLAAYGRAYMRDLPAGLAAGLRRHPTRHPVER